MQLIDLFFSFSKCYLIPNALWCSPSASPNDEQLPCFFGFLPSANSKIEFTNHIGNKNNENIIEFVVTKIKKKKMKDRQLLRSSYMEEKLNP